MRRQYKCLGNVKNSFSADFLSAARDKIETESFHGFTTSAWPFGQDGLIRDSCRKSRENVDISRLVVHSTATTGSEIYRDNFLCVLFYV